MILAIDLAGGSGIFLGVIIVFLLATAFAIFSKRGSGIEQHPIGAGRSGAPGVGEGTGRQSAAEDETEGNFDQHGLR